MTGTTGQKDSDNVQGSPWLPRPREAGESVAGGVRRHLWVLLLPLVFAVYSSSFNDRPVIEREDSVLGDADAANFAYLIRDFDLSRTYGDPYVTADRTIGDTAQKHKIHHVLYTMVAGYSFPLVRGVSALFGVEEGSAVYAVNALVTCVNIVLLFVLLGRFNPNSNPRLPFLILYAGALSTWVFGSVPESWPFSATLVLGFLLLMTAGRLGPHALAALVGVAMLNDLTLGALLLFVAATHLRVSGDVLRAVGRTAVSTALTITTWMGGLTLLSVFDPALRPDRYIHYTLWFKQFTQLDLPPYSPFVWQSILSNLFLNSFASNQSDAVVPQEALLYTLQQSRLGALTLALWGLVALLVVVRLLREWRARSGSKGWRRTWEDDRSWDLVLYCAAWVGITLVLFYAGGFLYSTVVVPVVVVTACRFLDLRSKPQAALLYATLAALLVNNTTQVLLFRDVLASLF